MVGMAKTKNAKGYSVRAATKDDLRAIVGIYNWAVNQTFATIDSEPLDSEEAQEWWEMHGKRSVLLVSVDETGVIGWAVAGHGAGARCNAEQRYEHGPRRLEWAGGFRTLGRARPAACAQCRLH